MGLNANLYQMANYKKKKPSLVNLFSLLSTDAAGVSMPTLNFFFNAAFAYCFVINGTPDNSLKYVL